jgi:hypothetical protein
VSPGENGATAAPGARFLAEIHEQPAALERLLAHENEVERAEELEIRR